MFRRQLLVQTETKELGSDRAVEGKGTIHEITRRNAKELSCDFVDRFCSSLIQFQ